MRIEDFEARKKLNEDDPAWNSFKQRYPDIQAEENYVIYVKGQFTNKGGRGSRPHGVK